MSSGLEDFSLFDLFRMEAEEQVRVLQEGLIELERGAATSATLERLMRAAHSIKGAARIVGLDAIVQLTHVVEDRFVEAQKGHALSPSEVDRMLAATDWLARLQSVPEAETAAWFAAHSEQILTFAGTFVATRTEATPPGAVAEPVAPQPATPQPVTAQQQRELLHAAEEPAEVEEEEGGDAFALAQPGASAGGRQRQVRISAERFDRILSLASESLVASRNLGAQGETMERLAKAIGRAAQVLDDPDADNDRRTLARRELEQQIAQLNAQVAEFDPMARANERTAEKLYRTVLAGRLRPFSDGITSVGRLVRDTARGLGKQIRLDIQGDTTRVDRDILERLEAPISHLVTNAIDHGIETPAERAAVNKPAEALLRIFARHENGRLVISVRDDGRGIEPETLRRRIVERGLVTGPTAAGLSDSELLEFLFLPGFSTRYEVSQVSGRGVGLNVVQSMVQEAGGSVVVESVAGFGTAFRMTLPVTRSVVKVIRILVEGERYAVPLVRVDRVAQLAIAVDEEIDAPTFTPDEGPYVEVDGRRLPVVPLATLLGLSTRPVNEGTVPMLLCGHVAFVVDRLVDEVELSVRRLDARLGKIPGVSAASLDEQGLPLLILDMEDLIQTALGRPASGVPHTGDDTAPHILVVDDSHTVRELERRLLVRAGYRVTTAQNGQEAWNLLRQSDYDLLISDVDMPQMNGIELVSRVRDNPRLGRMPVIILSYKDREEDRRRGLEAGADFYLTKGDFQNENFRQAVVDLIGRADT